jgi:hypothetical protein
LNDDEPLPRKDIISLKKFAAKGILEEEKLVLGWMVNMRRLTLYRPKDKFDHWTSEIKKILSNKRVKHKYLECLIGRLNHVAGIYNPMRHFLGRLYQAQFRASKSGWTYLTVHEQNSK